MEAKNILRWLGSIVDENSHEVYVSEESYNDGKINFQ